MCSAMRVAAWPSHSSGKRPRLPPLKMQSHTARVASALLRPTTRFEPTATVVARSWPRPMVRQGIDSTVASSCTFHESVITQVALDISCTSDG